MERIQIEQHTSSGLLWLIGWLFSIGYLHLDLWKGAAELFVWPYYIGLRIASLLVG
jgi:hypothetical protein